MKPFILNLFPGYGQRQKECEYGHLNDNCRALIFHLKQEIPMIGDFVTVYGHFSSLTLTSFCGFNRATVATSIKVAKIGTT